MHPESSGQAPTKPLFMDYFDQPTKIFLYGSFDGWYDEFEQSIKTEGGVIDSLKQAAFVLVQPDAQGIEQLIAYLRLELMSFAIVLRSDWLYACMNAGGLVVDDDWAGCVIDVTPPGDRDALPRNISSLYPQTPLHQPPAHRVASTQTLMPLTTTPRAATPVPDNYAPFAPTSMHSRSEPRYQHTSLVEPPSVSHGGSLAFEPQSPAMFHVDSPSSEPQSPATFYVDSPAFQPMSPIVSPLGVRTQSHPRTSQNQDLPQAVSSAIPRVDSAVSPRMSPVGVVQDAGAQDPLLESKQDLTKERLQHPEKPKACPANSHKKSWYWCQGCGAHFTSKTRAKQHGRSLSALLACRESEPVYGPDPPTLAEPPAGPEHVLPNATLRVAGNQRNWSPLDVQDLKYLMERGGWLKACDAAQTTQINDEKSLTSSERFLGRYVNEIIGYLSTSSSPDPPPTNSGSAPYSSDSAPRTATNALDNPTPLPSLPPTLPTHSRSGSASQPASCAAAPDTPPVEFTVLRTTSPAVSPAIGRVGSPIAPPAALVGAAQDACTQNSSLKRKRDLTEGLPQPKKSQTPVEDTDVSSLTEREDVRKHFDGLVAILQTAVEGIPINRRPTLEEYAAKLLECESPSPGVSAMADILAQIYSRSEQGQALNDIKSLVHWVYLTL
ncbi:hypothetical protein FRC11_004708 [Ceratobasidium sp. 423]|nr:hypothetical protein FRC11_004708 [Ceratobasidium sp. 423]